MKTTQDDFKKKTFTYSEKSEIDRAEYLAKRENAPREKRVYVDESVVKQYFMRESARAPRGEKISDVKRGRKFQRVDFVAAQFENESGRIHRVAPFCYMQSMNVELFENWFKTTLV